MKITRQRLEEILKEELTIVMKENKDPWDLRDLAAKTFTPEDKYVASYEKQAQKWRDEASTARAIPYSKKGKEERERRPIALGPVEEDIEQVDEIFGLTTTKSADGEAGVARDAAAQRLKTAEEAMLAIIQTVKPRLSNAAGQGLLNQINAIYSKYMGAKGVE